jgi:hypothetical protein
VSGQSALRQWWTFTERPRRVYVGERAVTIQMAEFSIGPLGPPRAVKRLLERSENVAAVADFHARVMLLG